MNIKINEVRLWKAGTSYVITIPKQYIDNHLIDVKKTYKINMEEVEG